MTEAATATVLDGGAAPAADTTTATPSQPAAQTPWYAAPETPFTDDDRAYIENKGWKEGPHQAIKSYRELERVLGNKTHAMLPPKMDDEASRREFFGKLGLPDAPDKYALPKALQEMQTSGEKLNEKLISSFQQLAHKADLLPHQFETVIEGYREMESQAEESATVAYNGEVSQTVEKLKTEFGDKYGEHVARGNLAMQQLGLKVEDVTAISEAIGVERATRTLMEIGGLLAQHKTVGLNNNNGNPPQSFVTDKAAAQDKISRIQRGEDANFKKALLDPGHPDHKNVNSQWREWQRVANS